MPGDFEQGRSEMDRLIKWAASNYVGLQRNEADTRLHLIDKLLFDCLGWAREDCHTEEHFEGKYTDYSFLTPRRLVVEAKREGIYFELPAGFGRRVCKISTMAESDRGVDAAIRQAASYCQERSIPFGAICNGHQIVAILGSRLDGIPAMTGECLVFSSLEDMYADFRVLWDNLSRPAVLAYNLHATLGAESVQPPPEKLASRIADYPGIKNRNPFQTELKILGDLFIEDVVRAPELEQDFLEKCYCPSGALSQYSLISKQILQARYSILFEKELGGAALEPVHTKAGLADAFGSDVLAASLKRRAIVLLGDVGVGKSIFIRHLIKVAAREVFQNALSLYVDFGKEPALAEDLESFVLRRCAAQLASDHNIDIEENGFVRGVYHGELGRFSKGIYGQFVESNPEFYLQKEIEFLENKLADRAAHLRSSLEHISKARKRQIVVFLDNTDQRPTDFQDRVFLIGQSLAETWPVTVFISLRPETFYSSRMKGALAAYQPRVFTISPPRIDLVIAARLQFVLDQVRETGKFSGLPSGLSLQSESLMRYIEVLITSFQRSRELVEFIDNLSGGNTRRALDFLVSFVGSGHVNAEKILEIFETQGHYTIPVHEFMRAVIFGDFEHYDPSASPVGNLFDISLPNGREHFLVPNLLAFVERAGAAAASEGWVDPDKVHQFCQSLGFLPSQIEFAIRRSVRKGLLETTPKFSEGPSAAYRITSVGSYTYKELATQFSYLDAMVVDTPIVDREARSMIGDSRFIADRANRALVFLEYLDAQHAFLAAGPIAFDWVRCSDSVRSEAIYIAEIEAKKEAGRRVRPLKTT
jgi:hypothetical protein